MATFAHMKKVNQLAALLVALLMMTAAAITVHKTIAGHDLTAPEDTSSESRTDSITVTADGVTVIHTAGLSASINGYAGPVPLDIYITDGHISKIVPLPNSETPGFFKRAVTLTDEYVGKTPDEALAHKPDAVTGATFSSSAIINNVDAGLDCYLGVQATEERDDIPVKLWVALAVALMACVVPLFVHNRIYHTVQLIANVAVLGFWCGTFLDYSLMLKYLSAGFSFPAGLTAIVMLAAAFIYPIFGRPQHYCNHICPLGSAQQLMGQVCGIKLKISSGVLKGLEYFRRILWAILMLLLWADTLVEWMDLELFQAFQFRSASWWIIGAACVFVALSAVVARPYCRFVCPTGSLFKRAENLG